MKYLSAILQSGLALAASSAVAYAQTPAEPAPGAQSGEFLIGPIELTQDANGVPVKIIVNDYFSVVSQPDGLHLNTRIDANLSDLQQKFPAIFGTIPLPGDNCGSYKPDNLVVSIPARELRADGDHATMAISGKVDIWTCLENPIPNSKLEWKIKSIGFGIKTKVPVVVTWPGSPIKNKTASQPFNAKLPLYLKATDAKSIGIILGKPDIDLTGKYVFITKGILSIANIDINEEARKSMDKAISPGDLIKTVPDELNTFNPTITGAYFSTVNGELHANINATALIPPEKVTEWISVMLNKK